MSLEPDELKLTFQLTAHNGSLEVRASAPSGGECRVETAAPSPALLGQLTLDEVTEISASTLRPVGQTLYQCLMTGDVAKLASGLLQKSTRLPDTVPTVRQAVRWIAQLGGFLGRKSDGEPGVTTLWRGWLRLQDIAATWYLVNEQTPVVGNR